jgi:hypothetical protein
MDKINLGDGTQGSGDSGLVGGGKINANYIALVEAVLGQTIWSTAVSENLDLSTLNTTNKTSLKAAINELLERTRLIDDSLTTSGFKTWSVDKIRLYVASNFSNIEISSNKFTLRKHPSNTNPAALEVNDMICNGWWGTTEFWRLAVYVGGATTNAASWNVIDTIEEIPLN